MGKSAQLPLQTWLPDAMAGPTPVSALIHAATMVTAGVYLIARTHVFFALAPPAQSAVAVVGAATLLLAGFSALTQWDIKRVLAYSTISQIGYMFLALGVGAWSAAIFHFMTHAFFKALLFLAAGIVINALHDEHNIFHMGGLRTRLPVAFWTFLIAGCSLAGLPLVTAGAYSKDRIIWGAWSAGNGCAGILDRGAHRRSVDLALHIPDDLRGLLRGSAYRGDARGPASRCKLPVSYWRCSRSLADTSKRRSGDSSEPSCPGAKGARRCHHRTCFRGNRGPWWFCSASTWRTSSSCARDRTQRRWLPVRPATRCTASGFRIGAWTGSMTGYSFSRWYGSRASTKVTSSMVSTRAWPG